MYPYHMLTYWRVVILHNGHVFQCEPLIGKVAKILTWRWKEPPKTDDELDHTHHEELKKDDSKLVREFFVKWHDMSYWHCNWITELQVSHMEHVYIST